MSEWVIINDNATCFGISELVWTIDSYLTIFEVQERLSLSLFWRVFGPRSPENSHD
jgi:hypothetical protein